jgi:hypothetical protein
VRVAEVHAYAGGGGEFLMPREFLALVVGKALALGFGIELSLPEKPARAEAWDVSGISCAEVAVKILS